MTPDEIDALLTRTLDDRHLSRNEQRTLAEVFQAIDSDPDRLAIRHHAFEKARATLAGPEARATLDWLEDVVKVLDRRAEASSTPDLVEAHFSPGQDCSRRIGQLLARASRTVDICVF